METKIVLQESEMPRQWYNINPDLPKPLDPYLHPVTLKPVGPDDLAPLFPMALILQEVSQERYIDIPEEVLKIYTLWRPTPLFRARRLEEALGTPAKIYYKYEGYSPPGSHKPNTAVPQAYYAAKEGCKRMTTETGAGQWGSALAFACKLFGLECVVYMVKVSYHQKPYRRILMETWGAKVFPSPTNMTNAGKNVLEADPDSPGSLGIAISEAVEDAAGREDSKYSIGSVIGFVCMHQTIVGQEAKKQLEKVGDYPDVIIGCVGGGSNFAGLCYPFVHDKIRQGRDTRIIAVEPEACPTLTKGVYAYDFGDTAKMAPVMRMFTLGHSFVPPAIHAGGLRYHGDAPTMCLLVKEGIMEARAYHQNSVFEAALQFARTEGYVPAPETAHAVKAAIDEALKCKETGEAKTILLNFSGHGHFDLLAYDHYLNGKLEDYEYPAEMIKRALTNLPEIG